jgi:hypothetical protein
VCLNHDLQAVSAFLKKYRTDLEWAEVINNK